MDVSILTIVAVALAGAVVVWASVARAREEAYRRRVRWCVRRGLE